jgi:hypothetical protein
VIKPDEFDKIITKYIPQSGYVKQQQRYGGARRKEPGLNKDKTRKHERAKTRNKIEPPDAQKP